MFAYLLLLLVSVGSLECRGLAGRVLSSIVLLSLILVSTPMYGNRIERLLNHPEDVDEYVDNRPLAAVLSKVPVEGTLLVSNDLRYPANNFARDERQHQLAALYGHVVFNAELKFSRSLQTSTEDSRQVYADRKKAQPLFTQKTWQARAINDLVSRYPITHLLIHRPYPHPQDIPLPVLVETDEYIVYVFERPH